METLIAPDQHWAIWAVLLAAAAFGLWADRTKWGARISGAVTTILVTFALSNLGVIPADAPAYGIVWAYLVPLAIPLLLFRADLGRIVREAGPTLFAFGAGALGTVAGTLLAFRIVPLGEEGWKLAGIFCATYVGGGMNYAATAEALELRSGDLLVAGIAADNLVMTLYFLVLFTLPSVTWLRRRYVQRHLEETTEDGSAVPALRGGIRAVLSWNALISVALAAVLCVVGYKAAAALGIDSLGILLVTALTVTLATVLPSRVGKLESGPRIGTALMQVFFAAIGASAHIGIALRVGPKLFIFAGLILAVHLLSILALGRIMRLDLAEIVVASNANMGGPTTAAAMAAARRWNALITPAILCGTLGYATATFIGVAIGNWLAP